MMMFVAAAAVMLASCSKEDNGGKDNNGNSGTQPIVGTWEYHETSFEGIRYYTETMSFKADGNMSLWFTCYDTYEDGSTWHYGISLTGPYTIDGNKLNFKLYGNGVLNSEDSEFTYNEPDYSGDPRMEYEFTYEISGDTLKVDKGDVALFGHGGHAGVMEYVKKR